jgi:hypothetical protein
MKAISMPMVIPAGECGMRSEIDDQHVIQAH